MHKQFVKIFLPVKFNFMFTALSSIGHSRSTLQLLPSHILNLSMSTIYSVPRQ